jgi:hypothetical protein
MIRAEHRDVILTNEGTPIDVPPDLVSATNPQLWMIHGQSVTVDKHVAAKWTAQTGAIRTERGREEGEINIHNNCFVLSATPPPVGQREGERKGRLIFIIIVLFYQRPRGRCRMVLDHREPRYRRSRVYHFQVISLICPGWCMTIVE